jgi:hypothetical protein
MNKPWLTSLKTETPQAGWELAQVAQAEREGHPAIR